MESELVYNRSIARKNNDFVESDRIRNLLDSKGVIIFDTPNGQEVYYTINKTRQEVEGEIRKDIIANKRFDAWLYSQLNKKKL